MKELEDKAKTDLLNLYKRILILNDDALIEDEAKKVYNEYVAAKSLLSEKIMNFVGQLFPFAYPNSKSGLKKPSKNEIKEIIDELKN